MPRNRPTAIVDIGSNSIRLVVYAGAPRIPSIIFNEKVLAGLGQGLAKTGRLAREPRERALAALRRFRILIDDMDVADPHVLATAALRDASNGADFVNEIRRLGFDPMVIPGEEEGRLAGLGVLSSIPTAAGLVGDLGGGSLELVEVGKGRAGHAISLPLGVLRIDPSDPAMEGSLKKELRAALKQSGLGKRGRKRPFYMVGGSWRALARLDALSSGYPLPITHAYAMPPSRPGELRRLVQQLDRADARIIQTLTASRIPTLPAAKLVLSALVEVLEPSQLIVSTFGIREGFLFSRLSAEEQARDPLIEAAREAGRGLSRFREHGDLLDSWIAPLFPADSPHEARLRLAACLLADVAWAAHPDFRAERGVEMALHGNWVGVDAAGRVMMAQALFSNFGGGRALPDPKVAALCTEAQLDRASLWGLAMRLGQRLSGGLAAALDRTRLTREEAVLRLTLRKGEEAIYGETVDRRFRKLAAALGLRPEVASA
jgi:exopolyphosphatase/guanosine-5'-triphosphate,3'-diphosphate pyrophosphatase